jgi:hypothetical protein
MAAINKSGAFFRASPQPDYEIAAEKGAAIGDIISLVDLLRNKYRLSCCAFLQADSKGILRACLPNSGRHSGCRLASAMPSADIINTA